MTDFRIDVLIDPAQATRGGKQVERQLDRIEKEAVELRNALAQALSMRDAGTAQALGRIERALDEATERAVITDARVSRIGKDISDRQVRRFNQGLDETAVKASNAEKFLKRAFAGFSVAFAIRQFAQFSDEATRLTNQLRTVIEDQETLGTTLDALTGIANRTRTDIGGLVQLYQRGSIAAKELGASSDQLITFVDRVGQALAVQGISATEARGALLQLSQALGSGIVRAEEFNSILEGAFPIAQAAARGLAEAGGSVAKLRSLIVTGQVTSQEFFTAFLRGSKEIENQFSKTESTIGQALTVFRNNLTRSIKDFNDTTGAANAIAKSILFLGEHLPATTTAIGFLTAAMVANSAAGKSLIATMVALRAAFLAAGGASTAAGAATAFATSLGAGRVEMLKFGAAATVLTGSLFLLNHQLNKVRETLEEDAKRVRDLEEDTKRLSKTSVLLTQYQRELNNLNRTVIETEDGRRIERGPLSESQLQRIEFLKQAIADLRGGIKQQAQEQRAAAAAAKEESDAIERQRELLEKIQKPMKEYEQLQRDLTALLNTNKITQEQFNSVLAEAAPKQPKAEEDPFAKQLESLKHQNAELEIRATKLGVTQQGLLLELELGRQGIEVDAEKRRLLAEQLLQRKELTDQIEAQKAAEKFSDTVAAMQDQITLRNIEITQGQQAAQVESILNGLRKEGVKITAERRLEIERTVAAQAALAQFTEDRKRLDSLRQEVDVLGQLRQQELDLLDLRRQHPALIEQIDRALDDLKIRQLEASNSLADGFERAFRKLKKEAEDLAAVGESVVNVFADRGADALAQFITTGKFSFKEFASSIVEDLTRIIARLLIVKLLSAAIGGGPTTPQLNPQTNGQPFFLEGRARGGDVRAGQAYVVGEKQPELFVPDRSGTILPSTNMAAAAPPEVKITMINVSSEREALSAMAGSEGEKIVLNHLAKNPEALRRMGS